MQGGALSRLRVPVSQQEYLGLSAYILITDSLRSQFVKDATRHFLQMDSSIFCIDYCMHLLFFLRIRHIAEKLLRKVLEDAASIKYPGENSCNNSASSC